MSVGCRNKISTLSSAKAKNNNLHSGVLRREKVKVYSNIHLYKQRKMTKDIN